MLFPVSFYSYLTIELDLVDVINARVSLKRRGNNYIGCCPFHEEKTPSFCVWPSKGIYHCFGCSKEGDAITFIMEYDDVSRSQAIERLVQEFEIDVPEFRDDEE